MIYTSRQLLDPSYISNYRNAKEKNYWNRINSLGEAGEQFSNFIKERSKREQEQLDLADRQKLIDEMSSSEDFNNPQFRAALYSFQKTGDRSGIDNYYQTKALNKAREEETAARNAEIQATNERYFDLAKRQIDSAISPEEKIKVIDNAIQAGIKANKDTTDLENELEKAQEEKNKAAFIIKEKKYDEEQEKKNTDIKNRTKDLIEEYVVRLEDIENKEEYNQILNELKNMAEANGLRSEIKWPDEKKIKKTLTPKEQDEYNDLLDKKNDGRLVKKADIDRFNYLSQYVK